jgi:hypothetical protein
MITPYSMNKGLMSMHAGLEDEVHVVPPLPDMMDNNLQAG